MNVTYKDYTQPVLLRNHLKMGGSNPSGEYIDVTSLYLTRNGNPMIPVMGEYHFARDTREHWPAELAKMKAGGVNLIATYMFWIYHEEIEGHFDFSGDLDIRAFIEECAAQGLEVVLRIGPWAHGECRNGGFPEWLQHSGIPLRCNDEGYMAKARIWYEKIYEQVKGLFYKDGGPIIGIQFENELVNNAEHLLALKKLALEIGYEAPIYTVTGWNNKFGARIPVDDVLPVFAAYVDAPWADTLEPLPPSPHFSFNPVRNDSAVGMDLIGKTDSDGWVMPYEKYPFATCELGSGLQVTHHRRPLVSGMDAYALSLVKLGCGNNLIGYYMYHGGTNKIGQLTTFQESKESGYPNDCPILNYDFHTCLSQYGEARDQYGMLNILHLFATDFQELLAPMSHVPADPFIPASDTENLRSCLRTDGKSGFVFVNHYQRRMELADVKDVQIHALDVEFPSFDVSGDVSFFFPLHMPVGYQTLRWATAQPLCRQGNTYFFVAIPGIETQYQFEIASEPITVVPGITSGFDYGDVHIVTLTFEQARHFRRLDHEIYIGEYYNLYILKGQLRAIEDGCFNYYHYEDGQFVRYIQNCPYTPSVLTMEPLEEPFLPPHISELELEGPRSRSWMQLTVSSAEGFVEIDEEYDVAQIYRDQTLIADNFYTGEPWRIPAALLTGDECYLVMSEKKEDFYSEIPMK